MFEDDDPQLLFLIRRWGNGDSILPAVRRLIELGEHERAGATARLALADPDCKDRDALDAALLEISSVPEGWQTAVEEYAKSPTAERWEALVRFAPEETSYNQLRTLVPALMRLGCEGDALFAHAATMGMTPDLFTLAASGTVRPETIERRGDGSPARPAWLGLAAQAAFARGDRFATIRYLREAALDREAGYMAWASISEIRESADDELNEQLDKVGVPRL